MQLTPTEILAFALPIVAFIAWLTRLEARMNWFERQREADLQLAEAHRAADNALAEQRLLAIDEKLDEIRQSVRGLEGMRAKVDRISSFISGQGAGA